MENFTKLMEEHHDFLNKCDEMVWITGISEEEINSLYNKYENQTLINKLEGM